LYPTAGYLGFPASGIGYENWPQVEMKQNIPEDTVALKEGSKVVSSDDKHVGNIEQLFVDPDSNRATHFLISQGTFFKDRKVVPARWVKTIKEDLVQLAVASNVLENLPPFKSD
jgi:sporulation protein YlmC with PRC-barrel domain